MGVVVLFSPFEHKLFYTYSYKRFKVKKKKKKHIPK